jgi:glyceraldehyde 3-phosphate dehydrogenase
MRILVNGLGRIGRLVTHKLLETQHKIIALSDIAKIDDINYLLNNDSVHHLSNNYSIISDTIKVNDIKIPYIHASKLSKRLDELNPDIVIDCTGLFKNRNELRKFQSNAKTYVLASYPCDSSVESIVCGVNEDVLETDTIFSNASCTTNCAAPIINVINKHFPIDSCSFSTIHAATSSQSVVDKVNEKNKRLGRTVFNNIIPSTTGASKALKQLFQHVNFKTGGLSYRVPVANVSLLELNINFMSEVELSSIIKQLESSALHELCGLLSLSYEQLVSSDFIGNPHSSILDVPLSMQVSPNLIKLVAWYDNEFGYSSRIVDIINKINKLQD